MGVEPDWTPLEMFPAALIGRSALLSFAANDGVHQTAPPHPPPQELGGGAGMGASVLGSRQGEGASAAVDPNTPGPLGGEARGGRRLAAELPGCAGERENSEQERSELGLSHGTPLRVPLGTPDQWRPRSLQ